MTDYVWHDENYDKRIPLTIDSSKIDEDLTDFPVLIHLSNLSGITSADVTSVFDELTGIGSIDYCTYNPADKYSTYTLSNGDLTATSTNNHWKLVRSLYGKTTGKWYWEVLMDALSDPASDASGFGTKLSTGSDLGYSTSWCLSF